MHNHTESTLATPAVMEKTKLLCQAILAEPGFRDMRNSLDTFFANEDAQRQYQLVAEKGEKLHHKQHSGERLTSEEIADYEQHRQKLVDNPVARGFIEAQQQMSQLKESVGRYVGKTLEIGRVPEEEDFEGCGQGCSCGH